MPNRDLKQEVDSGRFRQDLYYRLNVFPIEVAPLRDRPEDVSRLAGHYLRRGARTLKRPGPPLTEAIARRLQEYDWPGNVRELQNVIERAVIVSGAGALHIELPTSSPRRVPAATEPTSEPTASRDVISEEDKKRQERENILAALRKTHWQIAGKDGAAELLGLKPSTLASRIKRLGIARGQ